MPNLRCVRRTLRAATTAVLLAMPCVSHAQTRTLTVCTPDAVAVCTELSLWSTSTAFVIGVRAIGSTTDPLLPVAVYNLVFGTGQIAAAAPVSTVLPPLGIGGALVTDATDWEVFDTGDLLFLSAWSNRGVGGCALGPDVDGFGQAVTTCGAGQFAGFTFTPTATFDPNAFTLLDLEAAGLGATAVGASCGGAGNACVIIADTRPAVVPEPATRWLVTLGLVAFGASSVRRRATPRAKVAGRMRRTVAGMIVGLAIAPTTSAAQAFDFESVGFGLFPSGFALSNGGQRVTFSIAGPPATRFVVGAMVPAFGLGHWSLFTDNTGAPWGWSPIRFTFLHPISSITFGFGDGNPGDAGLGDDDRATFRAFDAAGHLVGSYASDYPPALSGAAKFETLTFAGPGVTDIEFSSTSDYAGYANSLGIEISASVVATPEPATLSLLAAGVAVLVAARRRSSRAPSIEDTSMPRSRIAALLIAVACLAMSCERPGDTAPPTGLRAPGSPAPNVAAAIGERQAAVCRSYAQQHRRVRAALATNRADRDAAARDSALSIIIADACR